MCRGRGVQGYVTAQQAPMALTAAARLGPRHRAWVGHRAGAGQRTRAGHRAGAGHRTRAGHRAGVGHRTGNWGRGRGGITSYDFTLHFL